MLSCVCRVVVSITELLCFGSQFAQMMSAIDSVTRLGDFFKVLGTKISSKEAQTIGNFLGYFEKPHSDVKTALASYWATFGEKNWATFYSNIWSHWPLNNDTIVVWIIQLTLENLSFGNFVFSR